MDKETKVIIGIIGGVVIVGGIIAIIISNKKSSATSVIPPLSTNTTPTVTAPVTTSSSTNINPWIPFHWVSGNGKALWGMSYAALATGTWSELTANGGDTAPKFPSNITVGSKIEIQSSNPAYTGIHKVLLRGEDDGSNPVMMGDRLLTIDVAASGDATGQLRLV